MKLAIMQPYLFPYIGYFQLIAAVDKLTFYDDVNYIKGGWINRNRLILSGRVSYITIPTHGASSFTKINEVKVCPNSAWRKKLMESISQSYRRAPYFKEVFSLIDQTITSDDTSIASIAKESVIRTSAYLNLPTSFRLTSFDYQNQHLTGVERVIDICHRENSNNYFNLIGGKDLYDTAVFQSHGIELNFIDAKLKVYKQFSKSFQAGLSIIDILMFNSPKQAREMIEVY